MQRPTSYEGQHAIDVLSKSADNDMMKFIELNIKLGFTINVDYFEDEEGLPTTNIQSGYYGKDSQLCCISMEYCEDDHTFGIHIGNSSMFIPARFASVDTVTDMVKSIRKVTRKKKEFDDFKTYLNALGL